MLSDQHSLSVPVGVVSLSVLLVTVTITFFYGAWLLLRRTSNLEDLRGLSLSGLYPLTSGVALPEAQDSMLSW